MELVEERKIKSKQLTLNSIHILTSNLDGTLQTSHANLILHNRRFEQRNICLNYKRVLLHIPDSTKVETVIIDSP